MIEELLFIGGPLDGKRQPVESTQLEVRGWVKEIPFRYQRVRYIAGTHEMFLMAYVNLTPKKIMELLIENYEPRYHG